MNHTIAGPFLPHQSDTFSGSSQVLMFSTRLPAMSQFYIGAYNMHRALSWAQRAHARYAPRWWWSLCRVAGKKKKKKNNLIEKLLPFVSLSWLKQNKVFLGILDLCPYTIASYPDPHILWHVLTTTKHIMLRTDLPLRRFIIKYFLDCLISR